MTRSTEAATDPDFQAVLKEVELLREDQLWNENVFERLCERGRQAKLAKGDKASFPARWDPDIDRAIWERQRQVARKEAREIIERQDLEDLYTDAEQRRQLFERVLTLTTEHVKPISEIVAEIDAVFPRRLEEYGGARGARFLELLEEARSQGVDWPKKEEL